MKIASIFDDFTSLGISFDCDLLNLKFPSYKSDLLNFNPDFLFIESAWFGVNKSWQGKISSSSQEFLDLLIFCKLNSIPTVFWCKEDPIHFHRFINSSCLFDYIFTSDINSLSLYKSLLFRPDVHLLFFSSQPRLVNPLNAFHRINAACFAGSYYSRYLDRVKDFSILFNSVSSVMDVVIYDRQACAS